MPIVQPSSVVKGNAVSVKDLFKNPNHIPVYQRDYVWKETQVKALWNDLIEYYRIYANSDQELINFEGYFLGAMVVIENEDNQEDEIVDGQQRLTSLTTIVSVCYEKLCSLKNQNGQTKSWAKVLENILAQADSGKFSPNLRFSDADIQEFFFNSTFLKLTKKEKEGFWSEKWSKERLSRKKSPFYKMREAILVGYDQINKFLKEAKTEEHKTARLINFVQLLTEGVILLRIKAMSYTNAYAIFESLNNRGIPLSQSDLIKNEVLKKCNNDDLDEVAENWQNARQITESIELTSMPDFVHYSYISRYGAIKAKKLYDEVKRKITDSAAAKKYSIQLEEDALALESLTESFSSTWSQETTYMLKDLKNVLNIKHCYPFLIAVYHKHKDNSKVFEQHVQAVMNFAFRYMKIMEEPLEAFTSAIGSACLMIQKGQDILDIRNHFRSSAPDEIFIKKFEEASFPTAKMSYFVVYYLEKVQLGGTLPKDHGVEQNLEHIMPKTPNVTYWKNALDKKNENAALYRDYLWKVGNLLPLPAEINKSIKNKSINLKISDPSTGKDYSSGGLHLVSPKEIHKFLDHDGEWSYESIDRRQKAIAETLAVKAWPL